MNDRPLTSRFKKPGELPPSLREYRKTGGYEALRKALAMAPDDIVKTVLDANLLGRGGAGFATGKKWGLAPKVSDVPCPRYFVANADEMEPGTFKDKFLMENDPHQFIEGVIISSFAVQADHAYIFLRGAYVKAGKIIEAAIEEARAAGFIGKNILGAGYHLDLHLHLGAGRYMCGEETGLINSLEGKRANPRAKPPYPLSSGVWGRPTIVNNVETICNVPHIVGRGADWFKSLSLTPEGGTKIYGVSGNVKRPGAWELPMGTSMRELLFEHAGGMLDGYRFRATLPGGASTDFLTEKHLDVKMDFASVQEAGSRLGTGTMVILDDHTCPIGFIHNLEKFFARESCGWCTPCREGLPWVEKILAALEEGKGSEDDLKTLSFHTKLLGPMGHTFCALAPGAMAPLQSGLKYFKKDFEEHLGARCPRRDGFDTNLRRQPAA